MKAFLLQSWVKSWEQDSQTVIICQDLNVPQNLGNRNNI